MSLEAILVSLNGRHIAVFIMRLIKSHQSLLDDEASYRQRWFHDDVNRDPRGKLRWGVPWIRLWWRRVNRPRSKALFLAKTISAFIPRSLQCTCLPRIILSTVAVHNYLTTTLLGLPRCNWRLTWTALTRSYLHFNIEGTCAALIENLRLLKQHNRDLMLLQQESCTLL